MGEKNGCKLFDEVVKSFNWTRDYPKPGIHFLDMSRTFGSTALAALTKKAVQVLAIEQNQIVLGVPTRGCTWATIVANAAQCQALYLSKAGVGTPLPNSEVLCSAGTAYSGEKRSTFTIRTMDKAHLLKADIVWVADDVCESGQTLKSIVEALQAMGCKHVRCLSLVTLFSDAATYGAEQDRQPEGYFSVIDCYPGAKCFPGARIFSRDLGALFTLRGGNSGETMVYGPPSMNSLILSCANAAPNRSVGDVQWDYFPGGGMPNIHFEMPGGASGGDIFFIYDASLCSTTQDAVVHALARNCTGRMTICIPYLPQGTMERVDRKGTLATAQTTLHSLGASMPMTKKGPVVLEILDIHATAARFFTTDRVQYRPISLMGRLTQSFPPRPIIAFPDDGAAKRFKHLFPNDTLLIFTKMRQGNERKITLAEKVGMREVSGAQVLIVDDLTRTGGTLLNTAKVVRTMGATHITAVFVHADFDVGRTISFARDPLFDRIVCTDSIPAKARALKLAAPDKVEVMGMFSNGHQVEPCVVTSLSTHKISAARKTGYAAYWTGSVPSRVPEQPVGMDEISAGAKNRLELVKYLKPSSPVISFESGLVHRDGGWHDVAYYCASMPSFKDWTEGFAVGPQVADDIVQRAKAENLTVGKFLQREYNLPDESAWIAGAEFENREAQLVAAARNAK
jgi:phosphoribosylpyrophosphate synthetase/non-canonical (house-cleaning) NTP pyrophosphatase